LRLLLDTHTLLWWLFDSPFLSGAAEAAISADGAEVFVSAVSAWEVTTKFRIGKLPDAQRLAHNFGPDIALEGFRELAVTVAHAQHSGLMIGAHKDPFDRMLIAQALAEDLVLVSNEAVFDGFGVKRIW
jgi:PIN domain nuclease of toxin-antitoxin system